MRGRRRRGRGGERKWKWKKVEKKVYFTKFLSFFFFYLFFSLWNRRKNHERRRKRRREKKGECKKDTFLWYLFYLKPVWSSHRVLCCEGEAKNDSRSVWVSSLSEWLWWNAFLKTVRKATILKRRGKEREKEREKMTEKIKIVVMIIKS